MLLVPTVTGIAPTQGPDGTRVTVTGQRLSRDGSPTLVLFGSRGLQPEDGATDRRLEVTAGGLGAGTWPFSVRVAGADSIDPVAFEVTT